MFKIPHPVLDVCREMDELRSINICPPVLLLRNRGHFLDTVSYVNDIFATGFVAQNHAPCFECVLGREKEWATFGEMSRYVSYFAFKKQCET